MTEPKQIDKFKQMAKELECDESEKAFDEKLGKLGKLTKSDIKGKNISDE